MRLIDRGLDAGTVSPEEVLAERLWLTREFLVCGFITLSLYAASVAMVGRIGAGKTLEVKDGGMGGWEFVIGLRIVRVVYISRNVTRAFFNHEGTIVAEQPRSY